MATLLYRLGRACAAHRAVVAVAWALLLVAAGTAATTLSGSTTTTFSIPGSESAAALTALEEEFPASGAAGPYANVVLQAPEGEEITAPDNAAVVASTVEDLRGVDDVAGVTDPLDARPPTVSPDRSTVYSRVSFDVGDGIVPTDSLEALDAVVADAADAGLVVASGGPAYQEVPEILGPSEVTGVVVAFAVLMITYGGLVAAGANLLTALVGVGIGAAGVTALTGFVDLQSTTPILAVMLGLAVGIDYALFIFARFRGELRDGHEVDEAVGRAVGTAGSAVVVAGLTVVIALTGLSVVGIPFLTQMGLAAAGTVAIAILVALTLVPALLRWLGQRVRPRSERDGAPPRARHAAPRSSVLDRWADVVSRRASACLVAGVALLAVLAAPVLALQTALPDDGTAAPGSSARTAYDLVAEEFGPGVNGPLVVLVQGDDALSSAEQVVADVQALPDVAVVPPPVPSADGDAALVTVVPSSGPADEATTELVQDIRASVQDVSGADVSVTGSTAVGIDVDAQLADALPLYLVLVVGLALVLLLLVFRSVLVPLMATVGFLLSFGAGLGVTTAVYQWGWLADVFGVAQPAPLFSLLPIITVGILFGLAMDYQVFMVSRIHEAYTHGDPPAAAVVDGFRLAAPVVVAAATIMAAVFAGFAGATDPLVGGIALALTVGVLADAFVVRMVVMPAVLSLVGHAGWWLPRRLDRVLPHVDVEGSGLQASRPAGPADPGPAVPVAVSGAADTGDRVRSTV